MRLVEAMDEAFTVCRDIGDSDPQRMSPSLVAEYVCHAFNETVIDTDVVSEIVVSIHFVGTVHNVELCVENSENLGTTG